MSLDGVRDETRLESFLDLLKGVVFISLRPHLSECYALAPYTVFDDDGNYFDTILSRLLYRAKYQGSRRAREALAEHLADFAQKHPTLKRSNFVAAAPKSASGGPDVARSCAERVSQVLGSKLLVVAKVRDTGQQKNVDEQADEEDARVRVLNSIQVDSELISGRVLVIDDTMRSGGTTLEMARALRSAGADEVLGLSICKDAKFTRGISQSTTTWAGALPR